VVLGADIVEIVVTRLAICVFLLIGISHIAQPRTWAQFFIDMHGRGAVGSFHNALLHFPLGAMIVSAHNVWSGLPMALTIVGWGLVLKGFLYFTFPRYGVRMLGRVKMENAWTFAVAGVFCVAMAGLFTYSLWRA
jgi:uncharacterized protein YjeT (DUF2065 family)